MPFDFKCICGSCTLTCKSEKELYSAFCHCQGCQNNTNAAYFWGVGYPEGDVELSGPNIITAEPWGAGKTKWYKCGACGAGMYRDAPDGAKILPGLRIPKGKASPAGFHIFCNFKFAALPDDGLPKFAEAPGGEMYSPNAHVPWPPVKKAPTST